MKIIISPSKTATYQSHPDFGGQEPMFYKQTKKLVAVIRKMAKKELGTALSIKNDLLDETFNSYKNFHIAQKFHAFPSYNGLVFKQLSIDNYNNDQLTYIKQHVRILDALYGVLEPDTLIVPYRLDMKAKLGINLYQYWDIDFIFSDEVIINLASSEFSTMIHRDMVTISFLQEKNGIYKNQATYSKMARGQMLDYMIKNNVTTVDDITGFNVDGYRYNKELSTNQIITFTR